MLVEEGPGIKLMNDIDIFYHYVIKKYSNGLNLFVFMFEYLNISS